MFQNTEGEGVAFFRLSDKDGGGVRGLERCPVKFSDLNPLQQSKDEKTTGNGFKPREKARRC